MRANRPIIRGLGVPYVVEEDVRRWREVVTIDSDSALDIHHCRVSPANYEEVKRLITLAGVFFMVAILFFLMKLEVPVDEIFKWSPIVWLLGVVLCCVFTNFLCYCRRYYKRRQLQRLRRQQELLLSLNLARSFPCLAPPPHDERCCGGRRVLPPSWRYHSSSSLPSYSQVVANEYTGHDSPVYVKISSPKPLNEGEAPPPDYEEALVMLNNERETSGGTEQADTNQHSPRIPFTPTVDNRPAPNAFH